jgi:glycosyltransferase involved in cell wall biosynthesis
MSTVLALSFQAPYAGPHGSALRVFHLMRELAREHVTHLATFGPPGPEDQQLVDTGVFRSITHLPLPGGPASLARHLRWSDEDFWRKAYPAAFSGVIAQLQSLIRRLGISVVVATDLGLAEFVAELDGVRRVVDDCDCLWLTLKRQMRVSPMPWKERLVMWLHSARVGRQESRLTSQVDLVTTVSPVDRDVLRRRSKIRRDAVHLVPNGVAPALVDWEAQAPEMPKAVAFWGNLDFPPNRDAAQHFYRNVFRPYLRGTGVTVYLIGPNPSAELMRMAREEADLKVTGFVPDLFGLVARIPVVINPMVSGSGIKNKVLEAFALRRAVVSTGLGMEGIEAAPGKDFLLADEPEAFAQGIQTLLSSDEQRARLGSNARELVLRRYTWNSVGADWRDLINGLVANGRGAP